MAVFKAPTDWESNDTAEELCNFFKLDIKQKFRKKKKDHNKFKHEQKSDSKLHLNENSKVIKKVKKKLNALKKRKDEEYKQNLIKETPEKLKNSLKIRNNLTKKKQLKLESPRNIEKEVSKSENIPKRNKSKDKIKQSKNIVDSNLQPNNYNSQKKKKRVTQGEPKTKSITDNELGIIEIRDFRKQKKKLEKLKMLVKQKSNISTHEEIKEKPALTLRQKMLNKLKAARFRFLNEQIYTTTSREAERIFKTDPESFKAYHEGYKQQVKQWPLNPLDVIVKSVKKMPDTHIVADFGCGEARLAKEVNQTVHSFDFVSVNDSVTACDMAHVPLSDFSVDIAVFCLSLMGTNLRDYLLEANRVLKNGGILKIAEVESRFEDVNTFIKGCEQYGFQKLWMDLSHNLFYFIDFKKVSNVKGKKKLPQVALLPCLYKKR
ncbi:ribosomal RNA-processing protein 8 [Rhynchophorus ferrugineus]|uniref:ribosomal RNA-processing protein 8 n=1 Tax=Rhynchophorus ferrugineus TaxID=354439 RepID=UPI003FCE25EA